MDRQLRTLILKTTLGKLLLNYKSDEINNSHTFLYNLTYFEPKKNVLVFLFSITNNRIMLTAYVKLPADVL